MKILMEWAIIILMFFGGAILYDANESDNTVEKSNGKIYLDVDLIVGSDKEKYDDEKLKELVGLHFKN